MTSTSPGSACQTPQKYEDWLLVLVVKGLSSTNGSLLDALQDLGAHVTVVDSGASQPLMHRCGGWATYLRVDARVFNWALCANVGNATGHRGAVYGLFLHDDIVVSDWGALLDGLKAALEGARVGMAVPSLSGSVRTPAQEWAGVWPLPYFHCVEYVTGAVVGVRRDTLARVGGWNTDLAGADWHAIDLQYRLARLGLETAVVPSAVVHHHGEMTWGEASEARALNRMAFVRSNGIACDFPQARPALPTIVPPSARSVCYVVNGVTDDLLRAIDPNDDTIIVDCDPVVSGDARVLAHARCAPDIGGDPCLQAVNMAGSDSLLLCDTRGQRSTIAGKRLRFGHRWMLPEQATDLHCGMVYRFGIGDFIMMTPALAAFHRKYPHIRIHAYGCWEAVTVLDNLPEIYEAVVHVTGVESLPPDTIDFAGGNGFEGTVRYPYGLLGLDAEDDADRRLLYRVRADEFEEAVAWLRGVGYDGGPLLAVQAHGSWPVKQWAGVADLTRLWATRGGTCIVMGSEPGRFPQDHAGVVLPRMSIRDAIAVISVCDAYVGHESGLTCAAVALGVPTVAVTGSYDARGFFLDVNADNVSVFRAMTPNECFARSGTSCRHDGHYPDRCPLRADGVFGADCLDAVSAQDVMDEIVQMPIDPRPIDRRFG